jgi:hypothetical protein
MLFNHLKKNIHSQNGEDGLIEYILNKIPDKDSWCCEFGAWDGKYLSNTFNLVQNKNYNGVFIEGDVEKYSDLLKTFESYRLIIPVNSWVGVEGEELLDNILKKTKIPMNFDILSIDVDGIDYLIWEKTLDYKPKVVIIEINSSFKPDIIFNKEELEYKNMLARSGQINGGVNFRTCYELGRSKGYRLFTHTGNMIFIHENYETYFEKELATDENLYEYFFSNWLLMTGYERP